MSWSKYEGPRPGGSSYSSNFFRGGSGGPPSKILHIKEGDWECPDPACENINFSKRSKCHRCGVPRPRSGDLFHENSHFDGPPGLFKQGDWSCAQCGNINWARRDRCNICNNLKPITKTEPRMGRGGGHYDKQDPADRNKHDSDNEEFDEFGRKKKKKNVYESSSNASSSQTPRNPFMNVQSQEMEGRGTVSNTQRKGSAFSSSVEPMKERGGSLAAKTDSAETNVRIAFPPAPKIRRSPSSSSSSSSSSGSSSSSASSSSSRLYRKRSGRSRSRSRSNSYSKEGKSSGKERHYGQNSRISSNRHAD